MEDYYQVNSQSYFQETFGADPTAILRPLADLLTPSSTVLDVGCGSGRDLCWLKKKGFRPTGLERAPQLASLARQASGCKVICADFRLHDFSEHSFNAIVLLGAMVHLQPWELQHQLDRVSQALSGRGIMLLTLKAGKGSSCLPDGRTFTLWRARDVEAILLQLGFSVIETKKSVSLIRPTDTWLSFLVQRKEAS